MPYACSASGGAFTLSPSREEAYRIYGQREERPYTVCSPVNPNACRTWLLHRFEMDCGGTRVDWLSVVEAASEQTTGRAWVEDGRMHMRMNQYWAGRGAGPDDPYPRWRRKGPYGDDFADRGMRRRGAVVGDAARLRPRVRIAGALRAHGPAGNAGRSARRCGRAGQRRSVQVRTHRTRDAGPLAKDLLPREPLAKNRLPRIRQRRRRRSQAR